MRGLMGAMNKGKFCSGYQYWLHTLNVTQKFAILIRVCFPIQSFEVEPNEKSPRTVSMATYFCILRSISQSSFCKSLNATAK